ncbi:hypothetical protein NliqN6_1328 [Naganishia liquefaciens]|uniref:Zn(2)-C6 fungal-type domain-containing protein n=1 Tax=Naganishia liquefaciens TaxID=104408 RepID=A0A8H3YEN6_9TREE|nr:hypothetical protein NliqN6_1328 [Naganishia liquefaciens]
MTTRQEHVAPEGKKRRHNVGKACENCRRRRVKCDGVHPECGTCKVYKDDCCWDSREDLRKPISRQQVEALQTRIADLEKRLRDHGLDPGHARDGVETVKSGPEERQEDGRDGDEDAEWPQTHLVENETGDFQVYGPTSAFRHLSISNPQTRLSPTVESPECAAPGFRKYLPPEIPLTEQEHDLAVDRFFRYYASWGQRTHPILFREDMQIALYSSPPAPKTPHYSPMLHNAILAIALCFSDNPYLRLDSTRNRFAVEAKNHVEQEGTTPTVATVQALLHLASYHSTAAEHNIGWLYMGMALRCALALGLNIDNAPMVKSGKLTEVQARERNVTFWTAVVQEGVWAPYVGRPVNIPEHTTPIPTVDEQLDALVWTPDTVTDRDVQLKSQPTYISSAFVETVKLMEIGAKIMNTLTGVISEISLSLTTWYEQLPPHLVITSHSTKNLLPHILMMHLSWSWLSVLLHRPFYRPTARLPGNPPKPEQEGYNAQLAIKHCDRAALHIVNLLQTWHRHHDLRFCPPTALQCCFVAGTTHLLAFVSNKTPKRKADALNRAKDCIRLMGYMAVSWPAGQQKQRLLENLLVEYGAKMQGTPERAPVGHVLPAKQEPIQFDFLGAFIQHDNEAQTTRQMHVNISEQSSISDQSVRRPELSSSPMTIAQGVSIRQPAAEPVLYPFLPSSYPEEQYLTTPLEGFYSPPQFGQNPSPPIQLLSAQENAYIPEVMGHSFPRESLEQLYFPDIDPWQHGINHGYFDPPPGFTQRAGIPPNDVPAGPANQAPVELGLTDPSTQALLRYYMQSDQDYLRQ